MFRGVFEQIGKRLTQQAVKKAVPVVSAAIGAFFDTAQMNKVLDYADVFYQKRFILEKGMRQNFVCEADGSIEWVSQSLSMRSGYAKVGFEGG